MTSYQSKGSSVEGKLPCGNPKRYGGRDVVSMSQGAVRGNKRKAASSTTDADESTKTEAELHLQRLLEKQMKTDVTLSGHFSEHRSFSEATKHRPGVDELIGVHDYQEYKLATDLDAKIDFLRHCGLNDEEIAIKLKQDMGIKTPLESVGYGPEPESQANKLQEIETKIKEKERQLQMPTATKGALLLTRQRMELEASHSQRFDNNINSTPVIKGIQMEPEDGHPNDPINHIPAMLDELEGKTTGEREPRRDRRRRRKQEKRMQYYRQFKEDAGNKGKEGLTSQAVADNETDSDATFSNDPIVPRLSQEDVVADNETDSDATFSNDPIVPRLSQEDVVADNETDSDATFSNDPIVPRLSQEDVVADNETDSDATFSNDPIVPRLSQEDVVADNETDSDATFSNDPIVPRLSQEDVVADNETDSDATFSNDPIVPRLSQEDVVADNETDSDATFSNDPIVPRLSQEDVEDDVTEHTHQPSQITFIDNEVKEKNLDLSKADDEEELSEATCAPRPPDWVSPKAEKRKRKRLQQPVAEEVEIRSDIAFLTKTDIARNRLAIDEIKRVPKFENYTPGNPNKVLFVKNLPRNATITDLMALFGCLQQEGQPRITIRLLSGKMKGQAFVKLPDEATASEALQLVNGYILHSAAVIVAYGKKT
ncbi:hypothetical protein RRG08_050827 [Elysia crispata]|uniref:RRM domain-containing protein n=1 Tax=Elysia crispata TaxID=231223 RepID=A0AAE1ADY5_9GAST|nr:hypothetical protein RRG08_050827 [Elysia crispata]